MKINFYVDEGGDLSKNSKYNIFTLGCSIVQDISGTKLKISNKEKYIRDKLYFDRPDFEGFHASVDHPNIYSEFVGLLREIPFRSYLVFIGVKEETIKDKQSIYIKMVGTLFKNLFLHYKNYDINIFFEQNGIFKNTVSKEKFKEELLRISEKMGSAVRFNINICGKEENLLAITDYINHIFLKAYRKNIKPCRVRNYELIQSKIGMIHDIDRDIYYNNKKELIIKENNCSIIF